MKRVEPPSILAFAGVGLLLASACGSSQPTQQLVDARRAYDEAQASEAAELTPDKLLTAEQALQRAEAAHEDDPGSEKEAHLAYLASRRARIAQAYGKIVAAKQAEDKAEQEYVSNLEQRAGQSAEQQTQAERSLSQTQQELERERAARKAAEERASAALASLTEVAKVNEEQRGTVITLPGGILFPSGGHELSPSARLSLGRVAEVLQQQQADSRILVVGHTDSRGSEQTNQELSKQRAESVKSFLVERGMAEHRLEAIGQGESMPIAQNDTAEGRATNRRVEIIVSRPGQQQETLKQEMNQQGMQQPGQQEQPMQQQRMQQPMQQQQGM